MDLGIEGYSDAVEVGQGGFGVVYRARQSDLERTVAIKILGGTLDERTKRRFDRERRALGALSGHPNIVTIHASGFTAHGRPYLVMEHLPRGSLVDRLADGALPWRDAAAIGTKLARALAIAHEAGILHRDIKPENILFSGYGEPKLADFGIARVGGITGTQSGVITASVVHAAPEILEGAAATEASDVYSLASTIFTAIAGIPPFVRDTDETLVPVYRRIATEPVPDLRPAGVPPALCTPLEEAMSKEPLVRTGSAAALGDRLQLAMDGPEPESRPPVTEPPLEPRVPLSSPTVTVARRDRSPAAPRSQVEVEFRRRQFSQRHIAAVVAAGIALGGLMALLSDSIGN